MHRFARASPSFHSGSATTGDQSKTPSFHSEYIHKVSCALAHFTIWIRWCITVYACKKDINIWSMMYRFARASPSFHSGLATTGDQWMHPVKMYQRMYPQNQLRVETFLLDGLSDASQYMWYLCKKDIAKELQFPLLCGSSFGATSRVALVRWDTVEPNTVQFPTQDRSRWYLVFSERASLDKYLLLSWWTHLLRCQN